MAGAESVEGGPPLSILDVAEAFAGVAEASGHGARRLREVVQVRSRLPSKRQQVAEARGRDECGPGAGALEERVRSNGRAVGRRPDRGDRDAGIGERDDG